MNFHICDNTHTGYNTTMAETQSSVSPQEEIQKLEQQLEEKKRALAETGVQAPEEKELFREVLKEHIETLRPVLLPTAPTPQVSLPPASVPPAAIAHDTEAEVKKQEARETIVRTLVEKAMTGTIEDAVKEAEKISPYMLDELHDHLVDNMYDKLVALRKIKGQ